MRHLLLLATLFVTVLAQYFDIRTPSKYKFALYDANVEELDVDNEGRKDTYKLCHQGLLHPVILLYMLEQYNKEGGFFMLQQWNSTRCNVVVRDERSSGSDLKYVPLLVGGQELSLMRPHCTGTWVCTCSEQTCPYAAAVTSATRRQEAEASGCSCTAHALACNNSAAPRVYGKPTNTNMAGWLFNATNMTAAGSSGEALATVEPPGAVSIALGFATGTNLVARATAPAVPVGIYYAEEDLEDLDSFAAPSPAPEQSGVPVVHIAGGTVQTVKVGDAFELHAFARPGVRCQKNQKDQTHEENMDCRSSQYAFAWTISTGRSFDPFAAVDNVTERLDPHMKLDRPSVRFVGGLLQPCRVYNMTVTVTAAPGLNMQTTTTSHTVTIITVADENALVVDASGGHRRAVGGSKSKVTLDVLELSRDRDDAPWEAQDDATASAAGIVASWGCNMKNGGGCSAVVTDAIASSSGRPEFSPGVLLRDATFIFTPFVEKKTDKQWYGYCLRSPYRRQRESFHAHYKSKERYQREARGSQVEVEVYKHEVPTAWMIRSRLDTTATRELTLYAHLDVSDSSALRSVVWSLASCKLASELGGESCDSQHIDRLNVTTQTAPWRDSYRSMPLVLSPAMSVQRQPEIRRHPVPLSLRAAVLRPGRQYTFRLEAQYDTNATGFAEVLVTTNVPPQSHAGNVQAAASGSPSCDCSGTTCPCALRHRFVLSTNKTLWSTFSETSPQLPLRFRFGFVQNASSFDASTLNGTSSLDLQAAVESTPQEVVLSGYSTETSLAGLHIPLPSGIGTDNQMQLLAYARDALGATSRTSAALAIGHLPDANDAIEEANKLRDDLTNLRYEDRLRYILVLLIDARERVKSSADYRGQFCCGDNTIAHSIADSLRLCVDDVMESPESRSQLALALETLTLSLTSALDVTSFDFRLMWSVQDALTKVAEKLLAPIQATENDPLEQLKHPSGERLSGPIARTLSAVLHHAYHEHESDTSVVAGRVQNSLDLLVMNMLSESAPGGGALPNAAQPTPIITQSPHLNGAVRIASAGALAEAPVLALRTRRPCSNCNAPSPKAQEEAPVVTETRSGSVTSSKSGVTVVTAAKNASVDDGDVILEFPQALAADINPPSRQVATAVWLTGYQLFNPHLNSDGTSSQMRADEYAMSDSVHVRMLVRCADGALSVPDSNSYLYRIVSDELPCDSSGWRELRKAALPMMVQLPLFRPRLAEVQATTVSPHASNPKLWGHTTNDFAQLRASVPDPRDGLCASWEPASSSSGASGGTLALDKMLIVGAATGLPSSESDGGRATLSLICASPELSGQFVVVDRSAKNTWEVPQIVPADVLSGRTFDDDRKKTETSVIPLIVFGIVTLAGLGGAMRLRSMDRTWIVATAIEHASRKRFMATGELLATDWEAVFMQESLKSQWWVAMRWLHPAVAPFTAPISTRAAMSRAEHMAVLLVVMASFFYAAALVFHREELRNDALQQQHVTDTYINAVQRSFITACLAYPLAVCIPKLFRWSRKASSSTRPQQPTCAWLLRRNLLGDDLTQDRRPTFHMGEDLIKIRLSWKRKFRAGLQKIRVRKMEYYGIMHGRFKRSYRWTSRLSMILAACTFCALAFGVGAISLSFPLAQVKRWFWATAGAIVVCFAIIMPIHVMAVLTFKSFKSPKAIKLEHHATINTRAATSAVVRQRTHAQSIFQSEQDDVQDELLMQGVTRSATMAQTMDEEMRAALHASLEPERQARQKKLEEMQQRQRRIQLYERMAGIEAIFECFVHEDLNAQLAGAAMVLLMMSKTELVVSTAAEGRRVLIASPWTGVKCKQGASQASSLVLTADALADAGDKSPMMQILILQVGDSKQHGGSAVKLQVPNVKGLLESIGRFGGTVVTKPLAPDEQVTIGHTLDDPSLSLPDQVGLKLGPDGIRIVEMPKDKKDARKGRILRSVPWSKLGKKIVVRKRKEGAHVLCFGVKAIGGFGFEMPEKKANAFQVLLEKYRAYAENQPKIRRCKEASAMAEAVLQARTDVVHANRELDLIMMEEDEMQKQLAREEKAELAQKRKERALRLKERRMSRGAGQATEDQLLHRLQQQVGGVKVLV